MRPLAVALTGGIAAGKSEALQAFARHGAATISSDALVHELYRDDAELQAALRDRWGEDVFADREARLVPEEEKVRRADFAYVNDGTLEELDAFVAGVLEELTAP